MADDQTKQGDQDEQGDTNGEETEGTDAARGGKGGDDDKPGAALLKALNEERDARRKAEAALRKREQADRQAETDRAIKAGEWESVAKAKDGEIADLNARIAELEGQIASAKLDTARERVAAKHKLPPQLAARLRGDDEAGLEADAKELAKLIAPPSAADTEMGGGKGRGGGAQTVERVKDELRKSGRYASVA